jgi:hypothetical protein
MAGCHWTPVACACPGRTRQRVRCRNALLGVASSGLVTPRSARAASPGFEPPARSGTFADMWNSAQAHLKTCQGVRKCQCAAFCTQQKSQTAPVTAARSLRSNPLTHASGNGSQCNEAAVPATRMISSYSTNSRDRRHQRQSRSCVVQCSDAGCSKIGRRSAESSSCCRPAVSFVIGKGHLLSFAQRVVPGDAGVLALLQDEKHDSLFSKASTQCDACAAGCSRNHDCIVSSGCMHNEDTFGGGT